MRRKTDRHLRRFRLSEGVIVQRKIGAAEFLHLFRAEGGFENLRVKLCDRVVIEDDDMVGVDVETVGGKIRRAGQNFDGRVGDFVFLNKDFRVREALKSSAHNRIRCDRFLREEQLELIFENRDAG